MGVNLHLGETSVSVSGTDQPDQSKTTNFKPNPEHMEPDPGPLAKKVETLETAVGELDAKVESVQTITATVEQATASATSLTSAAVVNEIDLSDLKSELTSVTALLVSTKDELDELKKDVANAVVQGISTTTEVISEGSVGSIKMGAGMTIPTANYANVKIYVERSTPCHPDKVDEAYDETYAWVDAKLQKLAEGVKSG